MIEFLELLFDWIILYFTDLKTFVISSFIIVSLIVLFVSLWYSVDSFPQDI